MYASANKEKNRNLLLKFLGKPLQHPYCPSPKRHKNVKFRLEHHYQPAHRLSLLDSVHCARSNMTESTEDQLQSEPGGSPAQASQKVQTKPVGAAGIGTPAAAVAAARSGIRQSPCTASPTQRPQIQIVAVIPVYDQPAKLESVVQSLRQLALPVIVVDDGSHEPTKSLCDRLAAPQVKVIHQPFNQGKGAAVIVGFKAAVRMGYTHVLQIDADGQLDFSAVPNLIRLAQKFPHALICGTPQFDASAPPARKWGRRVTNFWCSVNSLSLSFGDAMCGLRIYPLDSALAICENARIGRRMEFDPEILVRLLWAGVRVKNVPVAVTYPKDGVSHYAPFKDTMRISWMHSRLFLQMATRMPIILWSRIFGWTAECECPSGSRKSCCSMPKGKTAPQSKAPKTAQPAAAPVKPQAKAAPKRPPMTPEENERARRAFHAATVAKRNADRALAQIEQEAVDRPGSSDRSI